MPICPDTKWGKYVGFRKIYHDPHPVIHEAWNYDDLLRGKKSYFGLQFEWSNFSIEILNCFMIVMISF